MRFARYVLLGAIAFGACFCGVSSKAAALEDGSVIAGHLAVGNPPNYGPPTATGCTLNAASTDMAGSCAATATSGVAIAFSKAFASAPFCVVLDHTTASGNALATEPTTTGFTMGTTVSGDKISWVCLGRPGN